MWVTEKRLEEEVANLRQEMRRYSKDADKYIEHRTHCLNDVYIKDVLYMLLRKLGLRLNYIEPGEPKYELIEE